MMEGKCWKFGDNVNTDEIIPARYLNMTDEKELAAHCMEGLDPAFPGKVQAGDIIVAGKNFGCGSSREHAPLAIRGCGIQGVVAESFARIFFRNAINTGLEITECPDAAREAESGDALEVEFAHGRVVNYTKGRTYTFTPFSPALQGIIEAGGLIPFAKKLTGG
jgi:3-isopropylmalate/(R)-2-methylmalate dehydratase small subunit